MWAGLSGGWKQTQTACAPQGHETTREHAQQNCTHTTVFICQIHRTAFNSLCCLCCSSVPSLSMCLNQEERDWGLLSSDDCWWNEQMSPCPGAISCLYPWCCYSPTTSPWPTVLNPFLVDVQKLFQVTWLLLPFIFIQVFVQKSSDVIGSVCGWEEPAAPSSSPWITFILRTCLEFVCVNTAESGQDKHLPSPFLSKPTGEDRRRSLFPVVLNKHL